MPLQLVKFEKVKTCHYFCKMCCKFIALDKYSSLGKSKPVTIYAISVANIPLQIKVKNCHHFRKICCKHSALAIEVWQSQNLSPFLQKVLQTYHFSYSRSLGKSKFVTIYAKSVANIPLLQYP